MPSSLYFIAPRERNTMNFIDANIVAKNTLCSSFPAYLFFIMCNLFL